MSVPVDEILDRLRKVKQGGDGWTACCPGHEDSRPSLSVKTGDEGRVLLKCHAGCTVEKICAGLGVEVRDLFAYAPAGLARRVIQTSKPHLAWVSVDDAARSISTQVQATCAPERWDYCDAGGVHVFSVLRFELDGSKGKTYRPVRRVSGGWEVGGPKAKLPLYRLPELLSADDVYVVEGEKVADAARQLGLSATTSAFGSASAGRTDWAPIAGKRVVLVPDADPPGEKYAADVEQEIRSLGASAEIAVLRLPGLTAGQDLVDYVEKRTLEGVEKQELLREIVELATAVEPQGLPGPGQTQLPRSLARRRPFPLEILPTPLGAFIRESSRALDCPQELLLSPLMAVLGASVGNSHVLELKSTWHVPAVIWSISVADSGAKKSPAFKLITEPLRKLDLERVTQHKEDLREYKRAYAKWKKGDEAGDEPEMPCIERLVVNDVTMEGLTKILEDSPLGVLLHRDELSAWFASFDQYRSTKGADESNWLSLFNASEVVHDRKSSHGEPIAVPRAFVCVTGTIQPKILAKVLSESRMESGLAARFLFTFPERTKRRWTPDDFDPALGKAYQDLIRALVEYADSALRAEGGQPRVLRLHPDALALWAERYDELGERQFKEDGAQASALAKLEETPARLAISLHLIKLLTCEGTLDEPDVVSRATLEAAIAFTDWFEAEMHVAYDRFSESDDAAEIRQFLEVFHGIEAPVTPNKIRGAKRSHRAPGFVGALLERLAKRGVIRFQHHASGPRGGAPIKEVILTREFGGDGTGTETHGEGGATAVSAPEPPKGQWGEANLPKQEPPSPHEPSPDGASGDMAVVYSVPVPKLSPWTSPWSFEAVDMGWIRFSPIAAGSEVLQ